MSENSIWLLTVDHNWLKLGDFELESAGQWIHACVRFSKTEGVIQTSVDGRAVETFDISYNSSVDSFNITLGTRYRYFNHFWAGLVTNINLFLDDTSLDLRTMSADPCRNAAQGDFLSWENMTWIQEGDVLEVIDMDEAGVCGQGKFYNLPLPSSGLTWSEAHRLCSLVGEGRLTDIQTVEDLENLISSYPTCKSFWAPYTDEVEEGRFVNFYTGAPLPDLPWVPGNPKMGRVGNNVQIHGDHVGLVDTSDYRKACSSCNISKVSFS